MSKYQVFEISKTGKRIIESDLSLEKANSLSQEMAKGAPENVYGYEPVYEEGVKVGESYNFLFEGKNNDYDDEYKDFIEVGDAKAEKKWFDIEGSIEVDVDEDTLNLEFLKWIESKGWSFAGVIKPTEDE
jgi:hypothetical protein